MAPEKPNDGTKGSELFDSPVALEAALEHYEPDTPTERALVRKIDLRLMPMLCLMFILNFLDRTNIGNAKIAGMAADLSLSESRYAWALSIFFFGYILFEVPSNLALTRARPSIYLPGLMITWGALCAGMASVRSYEGLLAYRAALGAVEAGFFPGILYLLSSWYKPDEIGKRIALIFTSALLSGAFGGLLAGSIIPSLHGHAGLSGWRWLFLIEGLATIVVALAAIPILLDFPSSPRHLTPTERALAHVRLAHTRAASSLTLPPLAAVKSALADRRTYVFTALYALVMGPATVTYFVPQLVRPLARNAAQAQYLTIPIYILAALSLTLTSLSSDARGERRAHIACALGIAAAAALAAVFVTALGGAYSLLAVMAAGMFSAAPLVLAWMGDVLRDGAAEKRAVGLAVANAVGHAVQVGATRGWHRGNVGWGFAAACLGAGALVAGCGRGMGERRVRGREGD
ncbi:MFS general substrate transporter [Trichodelitschia bisporula]|uniref:MFS general substrate transporter n=1 Tax=Trichodelitschia bisporula TaxID=703511 RepID=A0A6G1I9V4_9PEZI|nr:MFS general substrate transporter [Trichodelitschia bisporula]